MSDISGMTGHAGPDAEADAASALLSVASPPLAPGDEAFGVDASEGDVIAPPPDRPERIYPGASFLDAMPPQAYEAPIGETDHISSVNSDDNGLYRMFVGVSP